MHHPMLHLCMMKRRAIPTNGCMWSLPCCLQPLQVEGIGGIANRKETKKFDSSLSNLSKRLRLAIAWPFDFFTPMRKLRTPCIFQVQNS